MNNFPVLPINLDGRYSKGISGFTRLVGKGGETLWCNAPIWRKHDFLGAAKLLTDELAFQEGSDTAATCAVTVAQNGGVLTLTSAAAGGTYSVDGAQVTAGLNFKASNGGLIFESRIACVSAAAISFGCGFTDTVALEEPFSVSAAAQTSNASNAAMFTYDTDMTTDAFWASGVNTDVDSAATTTGVVPVAATFNILRLEIDASGYCEWYVDDVLKHSVAAALAPATLVTPIVYVNSTSAAAKAITIDYIAYGGCRF